MVDLSRMIQHSHDPNVVQAILDSTDSRSWRHMAHSLQVPPANTSAAVKRGGRHMAERIARLTDDPKLLEKFSRDRRKGVRLELLDNPNLPHGLVVEMANRSIQIDTLGDDVQDKAISMLEPHELMQLLRNHKEPNTRGDTFKYRGRDIEMQISPISKRSIPSAIRKGGADLVKELTEGGYYQLLQSLTPRSAYYPQPEGPDQAYRPGDLERFADVLPDVLVVEVLRYALASAEVTVADVEAAKRRMREDNIQVPALGRHSATTPKITKEVAQAAYETGDPDVHLTLQRAQDTPAEILYQLLRNISSGRTGREGSRQVQTMLQHNEAGWTAQNVALAADVFDREDQWGIPTYHMGLIGVIDALSDQEYQKLPGRTALMIHAGIFGPNGYTAINQAYCDAHRQPGLDWAEGKLDDKPDLDGITDLAKRRRKGLLTIAAALPSNMLAVEAAKLLEEEALKSAKLCHRVGDIYFGGQASAWSLFVTMAKDWESGLVDLVDTVCALEDVEEPDLTEPEPTQEDIPGVEQVTLFDM